MIIKTLHLQNIGRHKQLTFDCAEPVVGLLGDNGSGKSTVLDMLEFLLTGDTRDKISSYVRHGEGKGVASCTFFKNGKEGYIMRSFGKSSSRKLVWDGREITAAKEVETTMREIFGADKAAIANAVFVNQGTLEKILFADKESERRNMFVKLVNMSFCAQRVEVLAGKVKRLDAEIVDLGPALDAARKLLDDSKVAYEQAAKVFNEMIDRAEEVQFCDGFLRAEEALKNAAADLSRLQNELNGHSIAEGAILAKLKANNYEAAGALMQTMEANHQALLKGQADFGSVKTGLFHYHRLAQLVAGHNTKLGNLLEQQRTENPQNLNETQARTEFGRWEAKVKLREEYGRQEIILAGKREKLAAQQTYLRNLVVPEMTEESHADEHQALQRAYGGLMFLRSHLKMQQEIRGCVQQTEQGLECPKCGLKISNPESLSAESLAALEKQIADDQADYDRRHQRFAKDENTWLAYKSNKATAENYVRGLIAEIDEMVKTQETFKFSGTLEEDKVQLEASRTLCHRIPETAKQIRETQAELTAAIKSKKEMAWVEDYLPRQGEFTDAAEQQLKEGVRKSEEHMTGRRQEFQELTRVHTLLENTKGQIQTATAEQAKWTLELQKPMPPIVSGMSAQVHGNIAQVRAELSAHQDARQRAYGRVEEANSSYQRAQTQIADLERRAEQDKEKRRIVEDLKVLRDIFEQDQLPMDVVKYHFKHLAFLTQVSLNQLGADFSIEMDPDDPLGFKFRRLDEPPHEPLPMAKLSGGQRVRLCTAFLIAVQQRLVKEIGLLVLDEPSTHLDESGVESLKQFLITLSEKLRNSEMQIWLVDHHTELKASLNRSLELT